MTTKAYQIKYNEVSISYLYTSNSLNLTKKNKTYFLRKAKFNKKQQKKNPRKPKSFLKSVTKPYRQ
jgi:hypothetical protein